MAKQLHDAVDRVRRTEHRRLKRAKDDRLTGSKYLWLMRPGDMSPEQDEAFRRWFRRATHSCLRPMAEVAKTIQRHLPNLLTYLRHHVTNAGLEAVNAVIQSVKRTARGFRNREHFKIAICFHCGGLDLYPHESR